MGLFSCITEPLRSCYARLAHGQRYPVSNGQMRAPGHFASYVVNHHAPGLVRSNAQVFGELNVSLSNLQPKVAKKESVNLSPTSALVMSLAGIHVFEINGDYELSLPKLNRYELMMAGKVQESLSQITGTLEWQKLPMDVKHYIHNLHQYRKAHFMRQALDAIKRGYKQIVLVGNGYNPMVVSLAETYPNVQFYCTDYDSKVVADCQHIYRKLDLPNINYIVHDCAGEEKLMDCLTSQTDFDPLKSTYSQVEGLQYYLRPDQEAHLFDDLLSHYSEHEADLPNALTFDFYDAKRVMDPQNIHGSHYCQVYETLNHIFGNHFYARPTTIEQYQKSEQNFEPQEVALPLPPKYDECVDPHAWDECSPPMRILQLTRKHPEN